MDNFLTLLAQARYVQELETGITARAIAQVFGEE